MKDKKVFLLDKEQFNKEQVSNMTEEDLEKIVADENYPDNDSIIKIDGNGFNNIETAIEASMGEFFPTDGYHIVSFGF